MQITKRDMLAAAGAVTAMTFTGTAFGRWEPSERYPDPAVQILDPSFAKYRLALAERRAHRRPACAGARARSVSATAAACCGATSPTTASCAGTRRPGAVSVFRKPSNNANGNTRDRQGRLVTCEHDSAPRHPHRVRRHHHRADRQVRRQAAQLAQRRRGQVRRLDLVHRSAVRHPRQLRGPRGDARAADQRLSPRPKTGRATVAAGDVNRPNGLAFSPDESKLYIVEAGVDAARDPRLRRGRQRHQARQRPRRSSPPSRAARPTASACDVDGNLWCGWGMGNEKQDGVKIFDPDRQADRLHRAARALRQRLLRRASSATACSWRRATRSIRST